ncbi:MAG: 2,3,4,5-tetrahydropyridine-2,6-dicarboxylate N-succinyltransferase, partial [Sphingomonas sp.]|nr:2,3,4,5-tetrahydropyridine-2,6-dicarboxylate N-succinyltransferase [Sphingomonas sp.]
MSEELQGLIEGAWEKRDQISTATKGAVRDAVDAALQLLDSGQARVAEPVGDGWRVNQWLKKAVLLSFRLNDNALVKADSDFTGNGPSLGTWWDKVPLKFDRWTEQEFRTGGFR